MIQQSKHLSPHGSNSNILKHKQAHFVYMCSPSASKMCCGVHRFEIGSGQEVCSRAVWFMPVVLLQASGTGFGRGRMRLMGIAKSPEAWRRAGALSCMDMQGGKVLGRSEGPEVYVPSPPGIQVPCCAARPAGDQQVMPDLQEGSGDGSGDIWNDRNGHCGTPVERQVSMFTLSKAEGCIVLLYQNSPGSW